MLIYTALGDSITAGENASSPQRAYPSLIVSKLRNRSVKAYGHVLAHPGWTSADLASAIFDRDPLPLERSTVVSVMIGGDDLAFAAISMLQNPQVFHIKHTLANYKHNLSVIAATLKRNTRARVIFCTQYNPFPNSPIAVQSIEALNQIVELTAQSGNIGVAPVHAWFDGKQATLISGYRSGKIEDSLSLHPPVHPNDKGHQTIAQGLVPYMNL